MKVTIYGSGYVGLVTGTCLAETGNDVLCVDINAERVAQLNRGEVPIYEPGLEDMIAANRQAGRLRFTTDVAEAVDHGLLQFIAVGTPSDEDGSADLKYVLQVARSIGEHMSAYRVIVDKSTVPVGTADRVRETLVAALAERGMDVPFAVVSNPEFLKEGAAISDFMKPDRVIVGSDDRRATEIMRDLYAPFGRKQEKVLVMDVRSAELTKYAANAMLATKISFMNELAGLAERLGADIESVRHGIGSDPRIGYHFIYPGCGYGGSCFPKDVKALAHTARDVDYQPMILDAVEAVNARQKQVLFQRLNEHFHGHLAGRTIALWGLAFKPNTDDMRDAPSRTLMEALWQAGAQVRAYDPEAMDETRHIYGERADLVLCERPYEALEGADALVLCTEWQQFRSPDFDRIRNTLKQPVLVDGRNVYDPRRMVDGGFTYYAIGRGASVREMPIQ
ncbi:UDP-glucose/GDP-mannose dehydrogenase family protein [Aquisalimonas sp. 2447]|uniref:UDP-glucose dehydrogenase family protein n=1 Tax=Aquisalimonas sp. 2447 TaxID=2740807 RepID=UPI0014326136|nr:UDP-glucose/GDP-mannose dehydrogenase family protein [Aquisalimonas sp. 2447]QIT56642.1 UDP-glucose/GDP-mannose dehydrogenase family protein [Aquisalimonas sp. 2447]